MCNREASRFDEAVRWLTAFAIVVVVSVTLLGNNSHARGADAMFTRNMVDRAEEFGGSYYENSIHNKGPLEPFAFHVSRWIGGYDGVWFVISVMIAIVAGVLAFAAFRTALSTGASRLAGFAIAIGVYIHFTLSSADYAGILYSRNLVTALLAAAWIAVVDDRVWATPNRQTAAAVSIGAILGLAVQTLISSVFSAAVVAVAVVVAARARIEAHRHRKLVVLGVGAATLTFASLPLWYLLRGSFDEFWAGWWTYARFQNAGLGLSFARQLALGWDSFYAYYEARPLAFLLIAAFVAVTVGSWAKLDARVRLIHVALLGWFAAGWVELVLSQRYTSHYFSITSVPTAFMVAALAGHVYRERVAIKGEYRSAIAWPLLAIVLMLFLSDGNRLVEAAGHTSRFTSVAQERQRARDAQPGPEKTVQALLDLVSRDHDALLAWTNDPSVYSRYRRTAATRLQQRYFVIGQIYGGQLSAEYVLPDTWQWFEQDVAESRPPAYLETQPIDDERFADYIASEFRPVFTGTAGTIHLTDDVADAVTRGAGATPWIASPTAAGAGWTVTGTDAAYTSAASAIPDNRLTVATGTCLRLEGRVDTEAPGAPGVEFHIAHRAGLSPEVRLVLDNDTAAAKDPNDGVFDEQTLDPSGDDLVRFALVVGRTSAVLVVDDKVVAAASIPESTVVSVESLRETLELTDLSVGAAPAGGGC